MKTIITLIVISLLGSFQSQNTCAQNKKNKKEKQQEAYTKTLQLVETGQFIFVPNRAYPQGGQSIDLTTNYGFIKIKADKAESDMPYFGRAYSASYGGEGGMKFIGDMRDKKIKTNEKKKMISYVFEIRDKDTYSVRLEIGYNGNTTANITSNNRSFISYSGEISPLEENDKKDQ